MTLKEIDKGNELFEQTPWSKELIMLLINKHDVTAIGKTLYFSPKYNAALLPIEGIANHWSEWPPSITFKFYIYNQIFKFDIGITKAEYYGEKWDRLFTIRIDKRLNLSSYQKLKMKILCEKAIYCYLGDNYYGSHYQVCYKTV